MRRITLACMATLLLGVSCGKPSTDRKYTYNDLMLVTDYTAKDTCTCLFVMGRDETYCRALTKEDPPVASWTADMKKKTVTSTALVFWGAQAHFVDDHHGCVLE